MRTAPAFTIIELLVSITIIMLLIGAASVGIYNARRTSRDTRRIGDIFLYGQAIDSYTLTNGGTYPFSSIPTALGRGTMCAQEITGLDVSLFANNKLPQDLNPIVTPTAQTSCPGADYGYTYYNEYGHLGLYGTNFASAQNVVYSLEVGLENIKTHDESILRAPSELGAGNNDIISSNGATRYRYLFNGKYCGDSTKCYN